MPRLPRQVCEQTTAPDKDNENHDVNAKTAMLLAALLPAVVFARIGETVEQCRARYGKPVAVDREALTMTWHRQGIRIVAEFDKRHRCRRISYGRAPGAAGVNLTDAELEALLAANAPPLREWQRVHAAGVERWEAGRLVATYGRRRGHLLTIAEAALLKAEAQQREKAAEDRLDGF